MAAPTLLADIGGTHARFALARDGVPDPALVIATAEHTSLPAALHHALARFGRPTLGGVAACAAGPLENGAIAMTNCPWQVSEAALAAATGSDRVVLVNDFTALAASLPALDADSLTGVGGGSAVRGAAEAVLGPGTGLGVSARLPAPGGDALVSGEGGHVTLAACSGDEDLILARLRERFGHVSAERVLSGDGLVNLFCAMHPHRADAPPARGEDVTRLAEAGDGEARACIDQFCRWLGAISGDVALSFGARGGVYLAGGILPRLGTLFDARAFRERFEAKGRYSAWLAAVPTWIITTPHPAMRGLARLLAASPGENPATR